jgi:DNA-binding transcriptional regulator YiaG
MVTKKQRVAAYLPEGLKEAFFRFKEERQLGDSQALIAILSEFLGVSQEVTHEGSSANTELQRRIEKLEERIVQLKDELLKELQSELLKYRASSIEQAKAEVRTELLSESPRIETAPGQLELLSESESEIPLEEVRQVSSSRETSISSTRQTLKTGELAKRLRVDGSTVSHWKPGGKRAKSADDLLRVTREKDPDRIGWIYLPDIRRFQPEKNIPSDSSETQKSESLDTTEPEF